MLPQKPLYFLTHDDNPGIFSGYGIPLRGEEKSRPVGMLMIDRPSKCPEDYLQSLRKTFGEVIVGPMTLGGDRGLFTQMRIDDPYSLGLVREDIYAPKTQEIADVFHSILGLGYIPKSRLKLRWSREHRLWLSEFDI